MVGPYRGLVLPALQKPLETISYQLLVFAFLQGTKVALYADGCTGTKLGIISLEAVELRK